MTWTLTFLSANIPVGWDLVVRICAWTCVSWYHWSNWYGFKFFALQQSPHATIDQFSTPWKNGSLINGTPFLHVSNTSLPVYFQQSESGIFTNQEFSLISRRRESTVFMTGVNVFDTESVFMWVSHEMPNHPYTYLHVCTYIIIVSIACAYTSAFSTQYVYSTCYIICVYYGWTGVWGWCISPIWSHSGSVWVLVCRWMISRQAGPRDTSLDIRWNAIIKLQ